FVGDCPTRILADHAQCVVSRDVVNLDDQPVYLKFKIVAVRFKLLDELDDRFQVIETANLVGDQKAQVAQILERFPLAAWYAAPGLDHAESVHGQGTRSSNAGIELLKCARRGVARVNELLSVALGLHFGLERLEVFL